MAANPRNNRVVHISTVHSAIDPRIRLKQLRTLHDAGMETHFVTGDPSPAHRNDGVILHRIAQRSRGRLWRMAVLAPKAVWRAFHIPAAIYHFHDPEIIPWAWLLLLRRSAVVYDIHEDYSLAMQQKEYIPRLARRYLRAILSAMERVCTAPFHLVIAESCYAARFPKARPLLNFPLRSLLEAGPALDTASNRLIYTGNVTVERGALNLAQLVRANAKIEVTVAGKCAAELACTMRGLAGAAADRLHIIGEGRYVPFSVIRELYARRSWLAGMVLIPDVPHYRHKHLTKFFQYMAVGLPIIASDVPTWRRLIAEQGLGLCVDPGDPASVAEAVEWLRQNPKEAQAMGRRGQELVQRKYNWEGEATRLISLYRTLGAAV